MYLARRDCFACAVEPLIKDTLQRSRARAVAAKTSKEDCGFS